jgi:hypothetical protein
VDARSMIQEIENSCAVLQTIAERYPEDSSEYRSIELAANSLIFLVTNLQVGQFDSYLQDLRREEPVGMYGQAGQ